MDKIKTDLLGLPIRTLKVTEAINIQTTIKVMTAREEKASEMGPLEVASRIKEITGNIITTRMISQSIHRIPSRPISLVSSTEMKI